VKRSENTKKESERGWGRVRKDNKCSDVVVKGSESDKKAEQRNKEENGDRIGQLHNFQAGAEVVQ
jgi:hypothetical protein